MLRVVLPLIISPVKSVNATRWPLGDHSGCVTSLPAGISALVSPMSIGAPVAVSNIWMRPKVVTSTRLPSVLSAVNRDAVPVGVPVPVLGTMLGAAGAVVGAAARNAICDPRSAVDVNEIIRPSRLTLWQPPQSSGLVGDDGTMNGDACEAPNGSRYVAAPVLVAVQ